jgi:calcineurin-like phosphoesterase family protein
VISVGDLTFDPKNRERLLGELNGNKILIRGNHDCGGPEAGSDHLVLRYRDRMLYLVHNPDHVPGDWEGWTIHGHHHWRMPDYPFIDGKWKTINVACELVRYTPVDLDRVLGHDIGTILRMENSDSEPVRRG